MTHQATIITASLTGLATGQMVFADPLLRQCGEFHIDLRRSTQTVEGKDRLIEIVQFDEESRRFGVMISPADGLTGSSANVIAIMSADIVCMHLDARVSETRPAVREGDGWLVDSGCEGHLVRLEEKC
ncbi:hypothetical protein G5V65_16855 [Rhodobacter sp. HX-7-19]|uniref:Uncharacterized protein n=1 Tax=Paragemmobacter kunshanensis TaxID=2583234 RepID=A0A6M1U4I1_9RHOB|nr:hypothetical protein [Rhodobacter kunshanensis]NGQ92564.1 hypothetical protein [Rhodobacter kunshanensis]